MRIISSQSFFLYAARPTVISTVDSGAEKSPVSMAPVPPLPLSFRPKQSKAEWSGEISSPNGTGPIAVGDLSTQSNNRFQTSLSPYRHAAPLEMTYGAGSSTVMGKGNNDTIPPPHCHFDRNGAKRSGVEWRNLRPNGTSASPSHCHFDRNGAKRSGVEWRNLRPQRHRPHCGGRSLDSEYQWSSNAFILIPTCSSARDDMLAGSSQSWGTETNDTDTTPSHLSFRPERSKAEWSGEISGPHAADPLR